MTKMNITQKNKKGEVGLIGTIVILVIFFFIFMFIFNVVLPGIDSSKNITKSNNGSYYEKALPKDELQKLIDNKTIAPGELS